MMMPLEVLPAMSSSADGDDFLMVFLIKNAASAAENKDNKNNEMRNEN